MNNWYAALNRPALTPPDWIFSPVWTVLYIMIAVSIFMYFRAPCKNHLWLTVVILVLHLASNFIWTYLFFGLQSPVMALWDIIFLDLSLVVLMIFFWQASHIAGVMLVPYLLWVSFATYLNYGFFRLN